MTKKNKIELINNRIDEAITNITDKKNTLYFFTIDSRNIPNSNVLYIYNLAKGLKDRGYKVKMVYQLENEYSPLEIEDLKRKDMPIDDKRVFLGVNEWIGNEFSELEHMNISKEEWKISPSDFLFIPEVFSGFMYQTFKNKIPCKRYIILQNYNYVTEFIPLGVEWANYGITDVIATTESQMKLIKNVFPYVKVHVLNPFISEKFRKPIMPKKLIVNIISKNQNDINRIIKPFYWKYPVFKFVSFRDLRNFPQYKFAEYLKEGAITLWMDNDSSFGYSALEAMRCNNIVIGKIPERIPEWMGDSNKLNDNGIWFEDIDTLPDIIARVVGSWMQDEIPEELIDGMEDTNKKYTFEEWNSNLDNMTKCIIEDRINELKNIKSLNSKINR